MSRGDYVEVQVALDGGGAREYRITARRKGRSVKVSREGDDHVVAEVDHTGRVVRRGRFAACRVLVIMEHPVDEADVQESRRRVAGEQTFFDLNGAGREPVETGRAAS